MTEEKKIFNRELERYSKGEMSPKEKKDFEKVIRILHWKSFHEECGCLQYAVWFCFLGLLVDAGYKAIVGGDWITPLVCFGGLIVFAIVTYILASLG